MSLRLRVAVACVLFATPAFAEKPAIAVLDIQGTGVDAALLPTLTEVLSVEIDAIGKYKVIAGRDIQSMLGFEKQKDVLGCTDAACLAEIGGALGVDRIIASHIGKVGATYVVNIKLINIRMATTEGRVYETVRGQVDALLETMRRSVGKLFGRKVAPPPPAPVAQAPAPAPQPTPVIKTSVGSAGAPTLAWALWIGGGLALGGGAVAGLAAKSLEQEANDSARPGGQLAADKAPTMALMANILYGVGIAGVAGGLISWLTGDNEEGIAMAPTFSTDRIGVSVSGRF